MLTALTFATAASVVAAIVGTDLGATRDVEVEWRSI